VLTGGTNSWIVQNTVEDNRNWAGMALFSDSHDNIVLDNISRRNALGYVLDVVQDNELRLNRAEFNLTQGFFIRNSPTTLVEFNTANDNLIGIEITEGSDSNRIRGNVMDRNTGDGFRIFASNKNHVEGNTGDANGGIGFLVFGGSSTNTLNRNSGHRNGSLDALDDGSGSGNVWTKNHFGKTSGF
jgi:parallel beta-helix repeat protein